MKRSVKTLSMLLALLWVLSASALFAYGDEQSEKGSQLPKVEIAFKVGDSVLKINGSDVAVATPYVVNGTTLVPLRVITEAFGAEVDWKAETQEITIRYAEVTILLQIGKRSALVNAQELPMLEAPELSDGNTMVPLRFITENFGADVSYDAETAGITVVKETTVSNSIRDYSTILKKSNKEKVGDSYLEWSMKMPKSMKLSYRSFDGTESYFLDMDNKANIYIDFYMNQDNPTMGKLKEIQKESADGYTLINQSEAKGDDGNVYSMVEYKSKNEYFYERAAIKDDDVVYVMLVISEGDSSMVKEELKEIVDSFMWSFADAAAVEDLSDVDDSGYRVFDNKDMQFSIKVPATFYDMSDEDVTNRFDLYEMGEDTPADSHISIDIYSKSSVGSARKWAESDRKGNVDRSNPELVSYTEVSSTNIGGIPAVYYERKTNSTTAKETLRDIFFEIGDYCYNLAIQMKTEEISRISVIQNSFTAKELDTQKVGLLTNPNMNKELVMEKYKSKNANYSLEIPVDWKAAKSADGSQELFLDLVSGAGITIAKTQLPKGVTFREFVEAFNENLQSSPSTKLVENINQAMIGGKGGSGAKYRVKENDGSIVYMTNYYVANGFDVYLIAVMVPEVSVSAYVDEVTERVLASFQFE